MAALSKMAHRKPRWLLRLPRNTINEPSPVVFMCRNGRGAILSASGRAHSDASKTAGKKSARKSTKLLLPWHAPSFRVAAFRFGVKFLISTITAVASSEISRPALGAT